MKTTGKQSQNEPSRQKEKKFKLIQDCKRQITLPRAFFAIIIIISITLLGFRSNNPQQPAPDFILDDIHGNRVILSEYRGAIVLLEFMATWCPTCRKVTSELLKINQNYNSKVVLISISVDPSYDSVARLTAFVEEYRISWSVCRDTEDVNLTYEIEVIPTHYLIDPHQYINWRDTGWISSETLNEQIAQLL
ncbi:MAG: TlpA family protein disulfide reductase [Candidatus Heimdallarchaeota archaeon]